MKNLIFNSRIIYFLSICFIIVYGLILPYGTDSGWIANTIQRLSETGEFVWTAQYVNISFGKIYFYINSLILGLSDSYFILKIVPIVASIISLYFFYRFLELIFIDKFSVILGMLLMVIFCVSTNITIGLRTESLYIPILFSSFYFIYKFDRNNNYGYLYLLAFLSSISAVSHPNGFVLIGLLFIFVVIKMLSKKISLIHFMFNSLLIITIIINGLLWQTNVAEFIEGFNTIAKDSSHSIPFYKEYLRYVYFLKDFTYLFIPLLLGYFGFYIFVKHFKQNKVDLELSSDMSKFLVFGGIFVLIYLTFIGVKWSYYLALFFPFVIFSLIYLLHYYKLNIQVIYMSIAIVFFILVSLVFYNLPKNEDFLKIAHIPSARVAIIDEVKKKTNGQIVLAPARAYYLFHKNAKLIQMEKLQYHTVDDKLDFILVDFDKSYKYYEKKLNIKLEYIRSFVYHDSQYNLFKVEK